MYLKKLHPISDRNDLELKKKDELIHILENWLTIRIEKNSYILSGN